MNGWIEWFNATSDLWTDRFWQATWQGAIVIAVAWLLTVLLQRLSPRVRSWIWRLVYVKLLLLLFWTTPIELALLPAGEGSGFGVQGSARSQGSGVGNQNSELVSGAANGPLHGDKDSTRLAPTGTAAPPQEAEMPSELHAATRNGNGATASATAVAATDAASIGERAPATVPLVWQSYLLAIWLLGLFAVIAWLAADAWRAAKLLRTSQPLNDERWRTLSEDICRRLGLRGAIRLRASPTARSPVLIRFLRPAIILPQPMVDSAPPSPSTGEGRGEGEGVTRNDVALAIAHEAAHLRRHDLAWNALAAIVHVAMYFHPLVWLAHRRIRLEQEMACDELVLQKLAAAPHDYGRMLVNVVRNIAPGAVIALK